MSLEVSGRLASLAASEIISHIGARPAVPLQQFARDQRHYFLIFIKTPK